MTSPKLFDTHSKFFDGRVQRLLLFSVVGALFPLFLSAAAHAQDEEKPLQEGEGYLFVAIKMERIAVRIFSVDGGGSIFYAHDFLGRDLKPGINYRIVKLPAGDYHWRKILMDNRSYFDFDKDRFPMTVKAGHINYGGLFIGEATGSSSATFILKNRATAAIEYLESCCQALIDAYPVRYGGNSEDPFLSYYFSLPEAALPEPAEDDAEAEK